MKQTAKFFNFDIDVDTLKKILDFSAWLNILTIVLLFFIQIVFAGELKVSFVIFLLLSNFLLIFCSYFFRYSVYFHSLSFGFICWSVIGKIGRFFEITNNQDLIQKLSDIRINIFSETMQKFIDTHILAKISEANTGTIKIGILSQPTHIFLKQCLSANIEILVSALITGAIFIYFAYSYQKLKKQSI